MPPSCDASLISNRGRTSVLKRRKAYSPKAIRGIAGLGELNSVSGNFLRRSQLSDHSGRYLGSTCIAYS
jgi:hypothetical protein